MKYYSTNGKAPLASLEKAVVQGLAEDRGLYMPERIVPLSPEFLTHLGDYSFQDIACRVADCFFGEDVPQDQLHALVRDTLSFDVPLVEVAPNIYSLELFHGPTLAFKDVGARFMARLLGVPGIHVYVLYPKGKVSPIQECQFTTLGQNITALEIDGVFDDCQALVKSAFMDHELTSHMRLTSANSINVARFLPQSFYYFYACAQLQRMGKQDRVVACVPSGNFGNICSALIGKRMGLPVNRFIAANNANDVFYKYLQTGEYAPMASLQTIANAMDVGDPSNFARILDLYGHSVEAIRADIAGATFSDAQIADTVRDCLRQTGYQLDPHGACGYRALQEGLQEGETGFFLETAHPAKFKSVVEGITGHTVEIPARLAAFMKGEKQSVPMSRDFQDFKQFLLAQ